MQYSLQNWSVNDNYGIMSGTDLSWFELKPLSVTQCCSWVRFWRYVNIFGKFPSFCCTLCHWKISPYNVSVDGLTVNVNGLALKLYVHEACLDQPFTAPGQLLHCGNLKTVEWPADTRRKCTENVLTTFRKISCKLVCMLDIFCRFCSELMLQCTNFDAWKL